MKLFKNHKHLTFVIAGSLLLLTILEGIWLKKLYADERNQLRESINQTLATNMARLQINYMQRNNVRLIDSFLSERKEQGKLDASQAKITLVNQDKNNPRIQIFIKGDTVFEKHPSKRDSFLSIYAYDFQKYVSALIEPEEIKAQLDNAFAYLNLTFMVSKITANELVPRTGDALVLTMPIGAKNRLDKTKLAVAVYGYKSYIVQKILPEALFAIFVFVITAVSFGLIYSSFREQKRLIALKNDFISNMTHELKTPITTVGVAIEAMKSFDALKNPEQTKEYLDISKNELNRLSFLVDKVLKMAAFEQKDPVLTLETLDMEVVMQEVLTSMQLLFDKFGASVTFEKKGIDFHIQADKMHITSVLYNLIDNALKYGGNNPSLRIELESPFYDYVRISIADKGQGIPPQYQDKIFDKFFRIPTGDVHDTKGHGLGLSYVASVVKQHGGKINVESAEVKGSRFSVFLPLASKSSDVLEASGDFD